ncbi:MAG: YesL family protein [Eubacterium sp.]|nr:YesL family protein [Eubacterium sp.]
MSRLGRFFATDNPVMVTLSRIADMLWVSIIFLVFCIPVITIGDAITSLYYVCAKVIRHGQGYVWREFWRSFKMNFKQSTIYWVIIVLAYTILIWNINYLGLNMSTKTGTGGVLAAVYLVMMIILALITINIFPIISRFDNKFTTTFKFAMFCAFRHILHTLVIFAMIFFSAMLIYVQFATPTMIFGIVLPGLVGFLSTYPMEHVLKKYQPKSEVTYDDTGTPVREWYDD